MKPLVLSIVGVLSFVFGSYGQQKEITTNLFSTYNTYKEGSLKERRIKHKDIQPLLQKFANNPKFKVSKVGESIEGRSISLVSIGTGKTNVFLWSQMHGDEPTATQAIFDILNFLDANSFSEEKKEILSNLTLHFLPMLNPDGAEYYTRRNTLGIDINRDALHLQSPEGRTLKRVRDSLKADFGFNLHDQSTYYNAERTNKPATISYLAPAYNYEKDINDVRANAMKVIVFMNSIVQKYAPGQVGRYNDDFEPRAFGDNIQKWGTSAILIESGGNYDDIEKQEIRKLNYVSILSAIYTIANGSYAKIAIDAYEKIPENDKKMFDLKMLNVSYNLLGKTYQLDLGINHTEIDDPKHTEFYNLGKVADQGDLSTYYGYTTFNASGYTVIPAKVYPKTLESAQQFNSLDALSILKEGFMYIPLLKVPAKLKSTSIPLHMVDTSFILPKTMRLTPGKNPNFFLEKNGKLVYAVINGYLINLDTGKGSFANGLILKK
ncbi:M14 family metallopeptidase [Cellulophaga sp. 20_2_10]|uniref:M14 family metallopeptidase n=1 Tax=Cellulophaga sp. 20_2_10 TaxID=2942476 RepID=UPI00201A52E6|nr:M14 metallopeptidase family protein [Cellulophaga sp. 20_2_10]MCL5244615.1 M14 family metallopeptidase [Cellulophaga sp. 20_2_10]